MGFDARIEELLEAQRGLVAVWQMEAAGCTRAQVRHASERLRWLNDGVLLSGHAPPTDWHRWRGATLTAPGTVLSEWSAAVFGGLPVNERGPVTVRRPGSGGSRIFGRGTAALSTVRVAYSKRIEAERIVADGIPVLRPGRVLLDLTARTRTMTSDRLVREALRLGFATPLDLRITTAAHRGWRGVGRLRALSDLYGPLDLRRTRSDAEALACAILAGAGVAAPAVNRRIAGEESDLSWVLEKLIVELDGPQFHRYPWRDAIKQAAWERAGWVVRRLPTDAPYDDEQWVIDTATAAITPAERAIAAATRTPDDVLPRLDPAEARWSTVRPVRS